MTEALFDALVYVRDIEGGHQITLGDEVQYVVADGSGTVTVQGPGRKCVTSAPEGAVIRRGSDGQDIKTLTSPAYVEAARRQGIPIYPHHPREGNDDND